MATRVVLGVAGGIAAYKACELLRLLTESGHDVTRRARPPPRCEFVGAPTWAALSGQPVATDVWDDVHEVPHVRHRPGGRPRRGRAGHRRPARPGRPRAGRRPAHQHAADRALPGACSPRPCTPRCGSTRPPWPTSPRCASRGVVVLEPGRRPAHRRRHRHGPAARPGRDLRRRAAGAAPRAVPAPPRPTSPAGTSWSPPAAPASRSTRCASSATAPPASRATRWPARPPPAAPRSPWSPPTSRLPDPAGVDRGAGRHHRGAARGDARGGRRGADVVVMAAAPADFRPAEFAEPKIKKADDGTRAADRAGRRTPTSSPSSAPARAPPGRCSSGSPPRPATTPATCSTTARAKLAPQGLRPARRQRGRRRRGASAAPTTQRRRSLRRRRRRDRRSPRGVQGRARRTSVWDLVAAARRLAASRPVLDSRRRTGTSCRRHGSRRPASPACREHRGTPPVHLRVGHRGPPGQDRRPDQRRASSTPCSSRTRAAGSPSRRWSPPARCTSPAR